MIIKQILNKLKNIYPVGSIYMSVNNTNPTTLFGGTWEQIKDTFLLSAGDTYSAGTTGGEATHQLTSSEMPSHTHSFTTGTTSLTGSVQSNGLNASEGTGFFNTASGIISRNSAGSGYYDNTDRVSLDNMNNRLTIDASHNHTGITNSTGAGNAHNNLPPYLVVYVWKRVS